MEAPQKIKTWIRRTAQHGLNFFLGRRIIQLYNTASVKAGSSSRACNQAAMVSGFDHIIALH
jgi:hypothetical protein